MSVLYMFFIITFIIPYSVCLIEQDGYRFITYRGLDSFPYMCIDRNTSMLCTYLLLQYTPSQRGNYHHSMFHNPTAAVNLFHVGKQYLTL